MVYSDEIAVEELPELLDWAEIFLQYVKKGIPELSCSKSDHFGFMAIFYLNRQHEHLNSICTLVESRDCALIARTMVEGLIQLKWAEEMPDKRGLQWKTHRWILLWKLMVSAPDSISRDRHQEIEKNFKLYEKIFRKKKYIKDDISPAKPEAYHDNWRCNIQMGEMCPNDLMPLYENTYKDFSDVLHWGTFSVFESFSQNGSRISFDSNKPSLIGRALTFGIVSLIYTAGVVNSCLNGKPLEEMSEQAHDFFKWKNRNQ